MNIKQSFETATFAGGCFWCTEAIFLRVKGVESVTAGYTGGKKENPTDNDIYYGNTGHAEAIQITFKPSVISYKELLDIFFHLHDPTTPNRQGNDVGTQYRSAIFYHSEDQKKQAEEIIQEYEKNKIYKSPIVTEIVPAGKFYSAEQYHQRYYEKNSYQPYCQVIIDPKIQKLLKTYKEKIKEEYIQH